MQKPGALGAYRGVLVASVIAATAWAITHTGTHSLRSILFFSALALAAAFLRVRYRNGYVGFEAAVAFPAILIAHDAALALFTVLASSLSFNLYQSARRNQPVFRGLADSCELTISYFVAGLIFVAAIDENAPAISKASGYLLLAVGYLVVHSVLQYIDRRLADPAATGNLFMQVASAQGKSLLLISPIVAVEVLVYLAYGEVGFLLAFLPVLLVAYVMRNESEAERENLELQRRNRDLSLLSQSSTQLLAAEGNEEILSSLVRLLSALSPLRAAALVTWGSEGEATVYRYGECLPSDRSILAWVEKSRFEQAAPKRPIIRSSAERTFPLCERDAQQLLIGIQTPEIIYGVLVYETEDLSIGSTEAADLVSLLVSQAAVAMQDQLLRREMQLKNVQLENQAATMSTILEVSNALIGAFDVDTMLAQIAAAVRRSLGFDVVLFALHEERRDEFIRRAHAGLEDSWEEIRLKRTPAAEIRQYFVPQLRISNSYFVPHTFALRGDADVFRETLVLPQPGGEWHPNDVLMVPLTSADKVIGYLSVGKPSDHRVPPVEKVQTLEIFANQAISAVQSAAQYEEIRRLTFIDSLTPAYNHRYFQETLAKEVRRHKRTRHTLALIMLDIDNFKSFNDTYGHQVGDEILKGMVAELILNVREIDTVARYGGEEFALILPETPAQRAAEIAERLRHRIEARRFDLAGMALQITISLGVALFPRDASAAPELIAHADAALYEAKKSGKNRVIVASEKPVIVRSTTDA